MICLQAFSIGKTFIYVDDTTILLSDKDPVQLQSKLIVAMGDLHEWFTANKLSLKDTCRYLMISTRFHAAYNWFQIAEFCGNLQFLQYLKK